MARGSGLGALVALMGAMLDRWKLGLGVVTRSNEIHALNRCFGAAMSDPDFRRLVLDLVAAEGGGGSGQESPVRRFMGKWVVLVSPAPVLGEGARLLCISDRIEEGWAEELVGTADISVELLGVLNACFDEVHIVDGKGRTLKVSPSCERVFGVPVEEFLARSVFELEDRGVVQPSAARLVIEQRRPVMITQRTGAGKTLLVTARPVFDESGELARIIITSKDITEIKRLEAELEQTRSLVERYREALARMRQESASVDLVYRSAQMDRILATVRRISSLDCAVMLVGESGVGKDMLARVIHDLSPRREGPFVPVNCGAIPENLFESEVFGYEAGAFTGASRQGKVGLIEAAHGGTLFLDEVTELSSALQVKLLRVLQDKRVLRVGGTKYREVDVRVIAASNRNVEEAVRRGLFREDLYYRLAVVPIRIPPLRERREDISPLVQHFLNRYNLRFGEDKKLAGDAMSVLESYDWPGNVRELQNLIERLVVTTQNDVITADDLPGHLRSSCLPAPGVAVHGVLNWYQARQELDEQLLRNAAAQYRTTYEMARALGVSQSMVAKKLKKLRLSRPARG